MRTTTPDCVIYLTVNTCRVEHNSWIINVRVKPIAIFVPSLLRRRILEFTQYNRMFLFKSAPDMCKIEVIIPHKANSVRAESDLGVDNAKNAMEGLWTFEHPARLAQIRP